MPKIYRITSKKAGFRRAGLEHPAHAVDHPADDLTAEQLTILTTEPMLVVQELDLSDDPQLSLELDKGGDDKAGKAKAEGK